MWPRPDIRKGRKSHRNGAAGAMALISLTVSLTVFTLFLSVPDSAVGALEENVYGEIVGASSDVSMPERIAGSRDAVGIEEMYEAQGTPGPDEASSVRPKYAPPDKPDKQNEKPKEWVEGGKTIGESDETGLLISILSVLVLFLLIYVYG